MNKKTISKTESKKDWNHTKEQLKRLGQEALDLAMRGELEVIRLTHQSKLHLDATRNAIILERKYYQLGKIYAEQVLSKDKGDSDPLNALLKEIKQLRQEQKAIQKKLDAGEIRDESKSKSSRKTVVKTKQKTVTVRRKRVTKKPVKKTTTGKAHRTSRMKTGKNI